MSVGAGSQDEGRARSHPPRQQPARPPAPAHTPQTPRPPQRAKGPAGEQHPAERPRAPAKPADPHHARRQRTPAAFTLAHAGKQVRIGPVVFWTIVGFLVIMGVWSSATATYFLFRDDLLTRLVSRQAKMQYAYEDRIAALRAQVDKLTTRQLLDQEQFEKKLSDVVSRQKTLESQALALGALNDQTITGSLPGSPKPATPGAVLKPSPISGPPMLRKLRDREATLAIPAPPIVPGPASPGDQLSQLKSSLDRVEAQQFATLDLLRVSYERKTSHIHSVLASIGLGHLKPAPRKRPALGGPFVPLAGTLSPQFDHALRRVSLARAGLDDLTHALSNVPVRQPLLGELDESSPFGVRLDPFIRAYAMHTGIDLRADTGDPVRATAAGKVTISSWTGGYGRLVEIDHGNGLATRYGHLSKILVHTGQVVKVGQIIGRVGSTGRSTGPHLHYETRINGEPVNPQKYLRAAKKLGPTG